MCVYCVRPRRKQTLAKGKIASKSRYLNAKIKTIVEWLLGQAKSYIKRPNRVNE